MRPVAARLRTRLFEFMVRASRVVLPLERAGTISPDGRFDCKQGAGHTFTSLFSLLLHFCEKSACKNYRRVPVDRRMGGATRVNSDARGMWLWNTRVQTASRYPP